MVKLNTDKSVATTPFSIAIRTVFLHLTKACNLRCNYCYFSARKPLPNEMSTAELLGLWPELVSIRPQSVVFTGGEPLLRPDLLQLFSALRDADPEHRVARCLNTNGHLVTPAFARDLVGLVNEIRVSLDAMPARNDVMRGSGNFEAAVRALDIFYAAGFEPKVLVTLTSVSLPDLEELICFLLKRKITRINVNGFRPIGRGKGREEWRPDLLAASKVVERASGQLYPERNVLPQAAESHTQRHCGVGQFLNIMPNGDVFPCHVLTRSEYRCGNVREQSLVEICGQNGLLGELAQLDFREMAKDEPRLTELAQGSTCMGNVYAKTRDLKLWKTKLSLRIIE